MNAFQTGLPFFVYQGTQEALSSKNLGEGNDWGTHWQSGKSIIEATSNFSQTCPFCSLDCDWWEHFTSHWSIDVTFCPRCGWWSYEEDEDWGSKAHDYTRAGRAILTKFLDDDIRAPTDELIRYLAKNEDRLRMIHPTKCEAIVAEIFKGKFGSVESCSYGRPDRGIDIIVLEEPSGKRIAVQVKRYSNPIELGMIHQFAGAMIDNNFRNGVFVTTSSFRRSCKGVTESVKQKIGIEIDLVDGRRLLEFIRIYDAEPSMRVKASSPNIRTLGECVSFLGMDKLRYEPYRSTMKRRPLEKTFLESLGLRFE